ncbi:helix-turn-helix domain-containing protein [Pseudoalteromonas sp. OOF1S-7]|uniref:helix-turn-helix domain-containing protein n=1 Tax=Pseudoalteromonas sp. OOF1S-7 TaxID=2917757 RepID=UPI001EF61B07|nr:helix-turn-helix domain-containing protein [Pseudoalteromonas sp. OOF1S-7]MCG7535172.1 helix-turn-helix domain-containing protein [Pseudoalteromonas sp. OOF1S-7]
MFSFSNIVALGCIQACIQSMYLLGFSGPGRLLAVFILLISTNMCVGFYVDGGLFKPDMLPITIWESLNSYLLLGPIFMAFVMTMTDSAYRFNKKDVIHLLPFLVWVGYLCSISLHEQSDFLAEQAVNLHTVSTRPFTERFSIIPLVTAGHFCLYLAYGSWQIFMFWLKQRNSSIFSQLCWLLVVTLICCLMMVSVFIVSVTAVIMELDKSDMLIALSYLSTVVGIFSISYLLICYGRPAGFNRVLAKEDMTDTAKDLAEQIKPEVSTQQKGLLMLVEQELRTNKLHLQPDFSQIQLAEKLNISRHQLSDVLALHSSGGFYELVNQLRVDAVIEELGKRPKSDRLINIAYDCGFNSKSSFNQVFKKYTGKTPSQYRDMVKTSRAESP